MIQNSIIHVMLPPPRNGVVSNNLQPDTSLENCRFDVIRLIASFWLTSLGWGLLIVNVNLVSNAWFSRVNVNYSLKTVNLNTLACIHPPTLT